MRRARGSDEANSLFVKGLIQRMTGKLWGSRRPRRDDRTRGVANTRVSPLTFRVAPHAYKRKQTHVYRHRAQQRRRVHQSRTTTRIDEARRPHDGATRSGVATLSSGGAGRGETWRGVRAIRTDERWVTNGKAAASPSRCRWSSVSPDRPFSRHAFRSRSLSRLDSRARECERAHALLPRLSLLRGTSSLPLFPVLLLSFFCQLFVFFAVISSSVRSPEDCLSYAVPITRCPSGYTQASSLDLTSTSTLLRELQPSLKNPAYYQGAAGERARRLARIHAMRRCPCVYVCACHCAGARRSVFFLSRHCYCQFIVPITLPVTN